MLSYSDKKWKELKGGYKILYDPTDALMKLEAGKDTKEAWEELWNELHHQGDVGEASYAAVPHLIRIHKEKRHLDWNLYAIVSIIEIERHRKTNPDLPKWLEISYKEAWETLFELGLNDLRKTEDELSIRMILGALAISKRLIKFGALISNFEESEIIGFLDETMAWSELYR